MTFKIIIETEDDISLEEMENIMDEALNNSVLTCCFDVEVVEE